MMRLLAAVIIVMPLLVVSGWERGYELPKLILFLCTGFLCALAVLWRDGTHGKLRQKCALIDFGMALWIFAGAIAVMVSPDRYHSFYGSYERGMGFVTELAAFGIFLAVRVFYKPAWTSVLIRVGAVSAILIALGGIVQRALGYATDFVKVNGVDVARMSGTLGHSAYFGLALAVLLPFCLEMIARPFLRDRIIGCAGIALSVFGIVNSFSRGAMLAAVVGCGVWLVVQWSTKKESSSPSGIGDPQTMVRSWIPVFTGMTTLKMRLPRPAGLAMTMLVVVIIFLMTSTYGNSWHSRVTLDASARIRLADWSLAAREGIRKPWGHGQETFWMDAIKRPKFIGEPEDGISDRPHNIWLEEFY